MKIKITRKFSVLAAVPIIALGLGLAACGTTTTITPAAATSSHPATATATPKPTVTHTVTAPPVTITAPASAAPATPAYVPVPVNPLAPLANTEAVVTQFYQDITDQAYRAAWALGGDNVSGGVGYEAWVAGYATTVSITLGTFSYWGSDQAQVQISALQSDGSVNTYTGTYTVENGVITAANVVQTS
jgi:hypothetical protein